MEIIIDKKNMEEINKYCPRRLKKKLKAGEKVTVQNGECKIDIMAMKEKKLSLQGREKETYRFIKVSKKNSLIDIDR